MPVTGEETRQKILDASAAVFSERGFNGATVREIVHRAGVNIAAVNYHFGNKEALYTEALKEAVNRMLERVDASNGILSGEGPARERLTEFMTTMILKGLLSEFELPGERLLGWEILSPTKSMKKMMRRQFEPKLDLLADVLVELGIAPDDRTERRALAIWVLGQAMHFARFGPLLMEGESDDLSEEAAIEIAQSMAQRTVRGLLTNFAPIGTEHDG